MTVDELTALALRIQQAYEQKNTAAGRESWNASDYMAGFVGDVGDLSKLIMAKQGKRPIDDVDRKIEHELADCLWSVLVLAHELNIDLAEAFRHTMIELEQRVVSEG